MKARIKATGEIINVEINKSAGGNQLYIGRSNWDGVEYTFLGDEIEPINEPIQPIQCNWQHYRIKAAIAIVQGWASTPQGLTKNCMKGAVELADALIEELKKGE